MLLRPVLSHFFCRLVEPKPYLENVRVLQPIFLRELNPVLYVDVVEHQNAVEDRLEFTWLALENLSHAAARLLERRPVCKGHVLWPII